MHIVDSCGWLEWFSDGILADAFVYATALLYEVQLYTSDADFQGLPLVQMINE